MYARICGLELLSSYITELDVGDILSMQALIKNPLDWSHFYEKILLIKKGGKTDFTVVTKEGDRLVGSGLVQEVEKWSNNGKFGFKIKVEINKQKSLADRRAKTQKLTQQNQSALQRKVQVEPPSLSSTMETDNNNNNIVSPLPQMQQ